jgi:hypothetical protein
MAFTDDLQNFLENRLLAFDPSIDLSDNSPAQLQIIQPIIQRFGEDPFSTDIPTFIIDRITQEFPDMAANDGGMVEDILVKPLQLLLEPFKREVEQVKIASTIRNAQIMSDDEADALGANWFEDRDQGNFSSGTVRLYYAQPTTSRVTTDKQLSTSGGITFFPIQNYSITAQQMLFNKQGSFFFLDIVVRASSAGDQFNVSRGDVNSIQDVAGVVKVANLTDFTTGLPRENNVDYFNRVSNSLTDRSLVTKRGVLTRTQNLFDSVRALQVIGAGEDGMDRDILTGTGQGFLHIAGKSVVYGDWLWTKELTYVDTGPSNSITPQPGDTVRFHPDSITPVPVVEAKVVSILASGSGLYLFLLDQSLFSSGTIKQGAFSLFKPGVITISGVPGGISDNFTVPDNTVHLGGHTDVFIRPTADEEVQSTLSNVTDDDPVVAITDLSVPTPNSNLVHSDLIDFVAEGVEDEDLLIIDTGTGYTGTYRILEVTDSSNLRVDSIFTLATTSFLRARIVKHIKLDLVNPKVPKLPYTASPVSDLQTNVGSNEFIFSSINIQDYGANLGDTINILEGPDAGEFTITGFGLVVGQVFVDKSATATGSSLSYEVYTKQNGLTLPLIRVKTVEVLDSTGQTTGITVPYGDAVDIRPEENFESAGHAKTTYDKKLVVFPDMPEWPSGLIPDPEPPLSVSDHTDARYSLHLAIADGIVRRVINDSSNQITRTEINVPPFLWNGKRDKLIALVSEGDNHYPTSVPGVHKTSDLANAKIGDSLLINDGPNQGKYIVIDVRVLELWGKSDEGHRKVALVQVDPPLKVDPIRTAINLINDVNGSPVWTGSQLFGFLNYAADWDNVSGFYQTFLAQLRTSLATLGITFSSLADLQSFFDQLIRTGYTTGPSAKGLFRTYFLDPVSAEFFSGLTPTTFDLAADSSKKFRVDPELPPAQILPESITPTAPSLWNRNMGLRDPSDNYIYLTSGSSFVTRGIVAGDILEFYRALNDLPARGTMTSSWMCVTESGSNVVQLILPSSDGTSEQGYGGVDNYSLLVPGQLFYIDSGPDIGAYVITKIVDQNWAANPPLLKIQLDQPLTHTTENVPLSSTITVPPSQYDFNSNLPAYVLSGTITLPATLQNKHLKMDVSTNGGASYTSIEHTFSAANPYNTITAIINDIIADGTFSALVTASAVGTNKLALTSTTAGPRLRIRVNSSPTAPTAHTALNLTGGVVGSGVRGAATLINTKRIYGTGLNQFLVGEWITIYAAKNSDILANGDDTSFLGTYQVTAIGTDTASAPWWTTFNNFVELNRTADFPAGAYAELRWIRHDAPTTTPATTVGGGTEISNQYVRFRMYDSVPTIIDVDSIPWSAGTSPLLSNSQQQLLLSAPVVDTGAGQRNFAHKAPYRITRPDVFRISSTEMSLQREGALYYVDIPVVGYGPGSEMNVTTSDGFILSGNRKIKGYTFEVGNEIFVYSTKEQVHLVLPNSVLPVGASADINNEFRLAGQNLQVTYNDAPLVEDLQAFYDSALDRVTTANMLARHFFPGYVVVDIQYSGGDAESAVAADIISYVNNIDPDVGEIRADLIQDIIKKHGASTVTLPIVLITLFHGADRRIRGMRSETAIGIGNTPFFKGNFKQTYFIAGEDTSNSSPRPSGEQVFLKRF